MKGPTKSRFEVIFSTGRRVNGELIRISAAPGTGLVGIATSRKLGSKPHRNRARRRVQEAVRIMTPHFEKQLDYVVIVAPAIKTASFARIQEEVQPLFEKAASRWASELQFS